MECPYSFKLCCQCQLRTDCYSSDNYCSNCDNVHACEQSALDCIYGATDDD